MLEKFLPRTEFESYEDFLKNYKVNIPECFNFGFDIIDEWAGLDDKKMALVWCNDNEDEKKLTYRELSALSNRAANYFKSLGISKGDVVMCVLRQRYEYWITAAALCKMGAVIIPASFQLTKKDIVYRANAAKVKAVVCVNNAFVIEQMEAAIPECPTVKYKFLAPGERDGWLSLTEMESFPDIFTRPEGSDATKNTDPMLVYFTSGTTGMPKMVLHDFTHPLGHIVTAKYWQCVREDALHMTAADSAWAKFGWGKIYGQMICGSTVFAYDMDKFVPKTFMEKLEKYKVTTFCATPSIFRFMLADGMEDYDLSSIMHCGNAGEPLSPEIFNKVKDILGFGMTEGFGQTESSVLIANFPWFEPKPGSMGKPSPLYDIDLVDADGNSCEDGVEGEIVIKNINAVGLFKGYYMNPDLTSATFKDGVYNTGDVAWRDHDGYYWFVGRNDDMIKCSGYRIGPFEVESVLNEHDAVLECAITAVPDSKRGQVVKATIVLNKGYKPSAELIKALQDHVKRMTAPYKYPRVVEFVDELPKTVGSNKIKRAEIRQNSDNSDK